MFTPLTEIRLNKKCTNRPHLRKKSGYLAYCYWRISGSLQLKPGSLVKIIKSIPDAIRLKVQQLNIFFNCVSRTHWWLTHQEWGSRPGTTAAWRRRRCWSSPSWRVMTMNRANPCPNHDDPKTKPRAIPGPSVLEWRRTCLSTGLSYIHVSSTEKLYIEIHNSLNFGSINLFQRESYRLYIKYYSVTGTEPHQNRWFTQKGEETRLGGGGCGVVLVGRVHHSANVCICQRAHMLKDADLHMEWFSRHVQPINSACKHTHKHTLGEHKVALESMVGLTHITWKQLTLSLWHAFF